MASAAETSDVVGGGGRGEGGASPPQGVFQSFGLMELEDRSVRSMSSFLDDGTFPPPGDGEFEDGDEGSSVDSDGEDDMLLEDEEDEEDEELGRDSAGRAGSICSADEGRVLYPKFDSRGHFVEYEGDADAEEGGGVSDHEIKSLTSSIAEMDEVGCVDRPVKPRKKKRKVCAAGLSFLLLFTAIASVIYLARARGSRHSLEDPDSLANVAELEVPEKHCQHNHGGHQKQNDHDRRYKCSPRGHSHTQKHHAHNSTAEDDAVRIPASAVATVQKSDPNNRYSGQEELCVEKDERVSFVRFDLSSLSLSINNGMADVAKATLNVYLKTLSKEHNVVTVDVHHLPHGGEWTDMSVSWYSPPFSRDAYKVTSFHAACRQLYEVDVTEAIKATRGNDVSVTFRLSTESEGDLWFASKRWRRGEAVPELAVTLA